MFNSAHDARATYAILRVAKCDLLVTSGRMERSSRTRTVTSAEIASIVSRSIKSSDCSDTGTRTVMPFNAAAGHSFCEAGIATYAPHEYGVYSNQQWIYIGGSENIEKSLYDHLHRQSEESDCILVADQRTSFLILVTKCGGRLGRQV